MRILKSLVLLALCLSAFPGATAQETGKKPEKSSSSTKSVVPVPFVLQVNRVDSIVDGLPAEFSAAIYENLIAEVTKLDKFQQVYRAGDKRAVSAPNLLTLKTTVEKFQQGSETTRAVTTVGGATKVYVKMQVTGPDGESLVETNVQGSVHFFGENLRATHGLATSMAKVLAQKSFAPDK